MIELCCDYLSQATIECGFTLKRICDIIRTYSQVLLNWLYRRARSEAGFSESKLSLSLSLLIPCFLFIEGSKRKHFTTTRKKVPGLLWALEIFIVNVIKFITLYMNQWLTNIILSCKYLLLTFTWQILQS